MKLFVASILVFVAWMGSATADGVFEGELKLYPEGCQKTASRICKLGSLLRFTSPDRTLVWEIDTWKDGNGQSGTTDGATIPAWAQPIIGSPYDETYLKAAIVHDHYCYDENHVRTWRQTHRMFYDALVALKLNPIKAKVMYYGVYMRGPKWVDIVPGENCGENCVKNVIPGGQRFEGDTFGIEGFANELLEVRDLIEGNPDISIEDLEERAEAEMPTDFFFKHGGTYAPNGPNDPNLLATK